MHCLFQLQSRGAIPKQVKKIKRQALLNLILIRRRVSPTNRKILFHLSHMEYPEFQNGIFGGRESDPNLNLPM